MDITKACEAFRVLLEEQQARIVGNCCLSSAGTNGSLRRITSDRGDIDFRINRGAFVGNVVVKDSGMEISGPRANLELVSKDGKAEASNKKGTIYLRKRTLNVQSPANRPSCPAIKTDGN